jgi:hypothetical protein
VAAVETVIDDGSAGNPRVAGLRPRTGTDRLAAALVSPFTITAVASVGAVAVAVFERRPFPVLLLVAAIAGWSSAWSP